MSAWTGSGDILVAAYWQGARVTQPAVANLAGGGFVVAWLAVAGGSPSTSDYSIVAQRFDSGGYKVGAEVVVHHLSAPTSLNSGGVAVDGTPDGGFVVTWTADLPNPDGIVGSLADIYVRRFDEDSTPTSAATLVNPPFLRAPGSGQAAPDVVALSTGAVLVSWPWNGHDSAQTPIPRSIVQMYGTDGSAIGDPFLPAGSVIELLPDAQGGFYVVCRTYEANGSSTVNFQHFNGAGDALDAPTFAFAVDSLQDSSPVAATLLAGGDLLLARASADLVSGAQQISLLRHDTLTGNEESTVVALAPIFDHRGGVGNLKAVAVDDGGFVLSWSEDQGLYSQLVAAQRFDAAAQPVGERLGVMPMGSVFPEADYELSAAAGGGALFTWSSDFYDWLYVEQFGPDVPQRFDLYLIDIVSRLYVSMFGRAPDGEGLAFWLGLLLDKGASVVDIANTMFDTEPARAYYPSNFSHDQIITSFYVNVLGREPDAEGLDFWTGLLDLPDATPGSVIAEIIKVVTTYEGSDPAGLESVLLFKNRVSVANYYADHNASIEAATQALDGVTSDPATIALAMERLELVGTTAFASIDVHY